MTDYELQVWEKEHESVVAELLNLAEELMAEGYTKSAVIAHILEMRQDFKVISRNMLLRLLHWHGLIYPDVWVRLSKEQIAMVRALHVDPRDLVRDLVEWYRVQVYEPGREAGGEGDSVECGGGILGQLYVDDYRKYRSKKERERSTMRGIGLAVEETEAGVKPKRGRGRPKKVRTTY